MNPAQNSYSPQRISPLFLLSIYGIIPLVIIIIAIDYSFFDLRLSRALPSDNSEMGWLNIIFMLPHVIASVITFADKEYIATYATRLGLSSSIFAGGIFVLLATSSLSLMIFIISIYTAYHQIAQQAGIASIITKNRSTAHQIWKWMGFSILVFFFFISMIVPEKKAAILGSMEDILLAVVIIFLFAFIAISIITARQSKTGTGILFIAANSIMLIFHGILFTLNMTFFMVLIPRIVHDVTAFSFYVSHNKNRNNETPKNVVSRALRPTRIPEYILTPGLALGISLAMTQLMPPTILIFSIAFLALFHYYWEGIMWKKDSPHRHHIYI